MNLNFLLQSYKNYGKNPETPLEILGYSSNDKCIHCLVKIRFWMLHLFILVISKYVISISFVILVFSIFDLILKEFNFLCSIFVHLLIDPSLFISVDINYKCMLVFKKSRTTSLESIFLIIIYILWIAYLWLFLF